MYKSLITSLIAAVLATGCVSQLHRGVVAMKTGDSTAHVGLSKNEVLKGDHVELYGNRCSGQKGEPRKCQKVSKGHGIVEDVISDDYVAVKFDDGVKFQEGDFVEKHNH